VYQKGTGVVKLYKLCNRENAKIKEEEDEEKRRKKVEQVERGRENECVYIFSV
jgi:hypothetical protein